MVTAKHGVRIAVLANDAAPEAAVAVDANPIKFVIPHTVTA